MARIFKYKSIAELDAENARLGIDLRFADDFSPLFRPVQIGPLTAGNALCVQPMEGCDCDTDGTPGDLTLRRYRRFGAGGAKLIWGEAAAVVEEGRANPRQLWIADHTLPAIAAMVEQCRAAHRSEFADDSDLVIGLQLTHSGRYSYHQPLSVSHDAVSPLRDDDLMRLVDPYVAAAKRAYSAGFQFVDIKQCHGYLLNELLGARSRPGPYGGSLENRTRLTRDIVSAIRTAVPGLVVGTRLNAFDGVPFHADSTGRGVPCDHPTPLVDGWGIDLAEPSQPDLREPLVFAATLRNLGVSIFNVSAGNPYAAPHYVRPFEYPPPDGYESPEHPLVGVDRLFKLAAAFQAAVTDTPVVGSGYSYLQEFLMHAATANVRDGRCAFAGVGRATLAQPDFVKQVMDHGRLDRKRVCRTFSYCTALMRSKHNILGQFSTGCPPFDKEGYAAIWNEAQSLKVRGNRT